MSKDLKNMFSLNGKKALVIGGAGGIGGAIARGLACAGAEVAIASRNMEKLEKAAKEMQAETGCKFKTYQVDVSSEDSIIALAKKTREEWGIVDILVNSQGLNHKFLAEKHPMDEWDSMYAVNVRGVFICCKEFAKGMIEQQYGRIINVGSIGATRTSTSGISACYSSSKGAVRTLTMNLAAGWAKYGITVNGVDPILTPTGMMIEIFKQDPDKKASVESRNPMGRMGEPEDCAGPAVFFASEAAGYVTGQFICPDGGLLTLQ